MCVCVCVDQKSAKLSEDKIFENKNNPPHEEMLFCNLTYNHNIFPARVTLVNYNDKPTKILTNYENKILNTFSKMYFKNLIII